MQKSIHPQYNENITVVCSCGNKFTTGSTKPSLSVEVCYKCHPFYSGEQRFLDVKGRVDEFQKRMQVAKQYQSTVKANKNKKSNQKDEKQAKTLRELLSEV